MLALGAHGDEAATQPRAALRIHLEHGVRSPRTRRTRPRGGDREFGHDGAVTAVETDGGEQDARRGGADGFRSGVAMHDTTLECEMDTGCAVTKMKAHKPSGLVAVAGSDRCVRVLDTVGARRVSEPSRQNRTSRLSISPPTGGGYSPRRETARCACGTSPRRDSCRPCVCPESHPSSGSRSPRTWTCSPPCTRDEGACTCGRTVRCTRRAGRRGFANRDEDEENETGAAEEVSVELPRLHADANEAEEIVLGGPVPRPGGGGEKDDGEGRNPTTPQARNQIAPSPPSPRRRVWRRWRSSRARSGWGYSTSRPSASETNPSRRRRNPRRRRFSFPPSRGSNARRCSTSPENADDDEDAVPGSKILTTSVANGGDVEGTFLRLIRRGKAAAEAAEDRALAEGKSGGRKAKSKFKSASSNGESNGETVGGPYADVLAHLRAKGPSALDAEIRALGPWDASDDDGRGGGGARRRFGVFRRRGALGRNFELLHALLAHFLRVHGAAIQSRESLRMRADRVRDAARKTWEGLDALMQEVRCALGFFGGQHGQ